jgi:hypothetical protein
VGGFYGREPAICTRARCVTTLGGQRAAPLVFGGRADAAPQHKPGLTGGNDARTGMPAGMPAGAMCVQRFDDSLNSAIHITYRISLRSSSMPEPRDPLLKVLIRCVADSERPRMLSVAVPRSAGPGDPPRRRTRSRSRVWESCNSVMIPPLVHQRRPCYDFYFL